MLRILKFYLGAAIVILTGAGPLQANTLEKAQAAYQSGQYKKAADLYLQLVEASATPTASVFHNLGLAFGRQQELGPAVASYLRALQLQPRQGDFQYNLHFLLGQAQDKLDGNFPRPAAARVLMGNWTSERELYYLTLGFFLLTAGSFSYALLRKNFQSSAFSAGGVFLLLTIYLAVSFVYKLRFTPDQGAVVVSKLEAYSGPTQSVVIFELHAGAPFQILETSGEWVKIELSDQKRGWVRTDGIASFGSEHMILPPPLSSKS